MIRVAYDSQIFAQQTFGGVSRYVCQLARHISASSDIRSRIVAPMHINEYLAGLPPQLCRGFSDRYKDCPDVVRRVVYRGTEEWLMRSYRPHVIHETYYAAKRRGPSNARRVVTIHDMIHEKFSASFRELRGDIAERKRRAALRADHVIFISESTRRDALELIELDPARTSVIHHGFDLLAQEDAFDLEKFSNGRPYILYVGLRSGYKNFASLAKAYGQSPPLRSGFRLVCFGGGKLTRDEAEMLRHLELGDDDVECLQGEDQLLRRLYRGAALFVYPSLYEGFGIPPLEAMAHDCPVACSNTSSIPEVVADAGEFFDPSDVDSIQSALEAVLSSPSRRKELIDRGRARLRAFSWERCAQQTAAVYRQLAE